MNKTTQSNDLTEQVAKVIDPEAFGLPDNSEYGSITDRDTARDRARLVIALLTGSAMDAP